MPASYRKGQVDPSVYFRAIKSCLNCSSIPLSLNEVCIVQTGGTPEAVVAAIAAGFSTVIYIAQDDNEWVMMQLPTLSEERESTINYSLHLGRSPQPPRIR